VTKRSHSRAYSCSDIIREKNAFQPSLWTTDQTFVFFPFFRLPIHSNYHVFLKFLASTIRFWNTLTQRPASSPDDDPGLGNDSGAEAKKKRARYCSNDQQRDKLALSSNLLLLSNDAQTKRWRQSATTYRCNTSPCFPSASSHCRRNFFSLCWCFRIWKKIKSGVKHRSRCHGNLTHSVRNKQI